MKPRTFNGDLAALPAALRPLTEHRRWVVWTWTKRSKSDKWTKPPHRADYPSAFALSNDPSTWSSYATAVAAVKAGEADGIGYMLTHADGLPNGTGAIDLDNCRDPDSGQLAAWAQELVDETDSYTETTVSGTGVRIIGTVEGADLHTPVEAPDGGKVELYRRATRVITVSGLQIGNCDELRNIDELIDRAHERFKEKPKRSDYLNTPALANLDAWVPELFPSARKGANGGYRVTSEMLGRDLEEDLSISPKGIKDFGVHDMGDPREGRRTPVDIVMEYGGKDFGAACAWLCSKLGIDPGSAPEFSESALALTFAERYGGELRFVEAWGRWMRWDGARWEHEKTLLAFDRAHLICREVARAFRLVSNASPRPIASAKTASGVVALARADRRLAATVEIWDADPWLLNTPGGVVDLRTGEMRPGEPEDYMTKITAVAPDKGCSIKLWLSVLRRSMSGDDRMVAYLRRLFGYALTGLTTAETFAFFFGEGANGKTKIIEAVGGCMGDYRIVTPMETFLASRNERHPTEIADLCGARLVTAVETDEGRRWDAAKVKALTGGDTQKARFMHKDLFAFKPQFKPIVHGNKKPRLRSLDEAMRRRLHLVPFEVIIPQAERDEELGAKLKAEGSGILAWMIGGCIEWQAFGLAPPNKVIEATDAYFASQDAVGRWIEENCRLDPNVATKRNDLWADWKVWAEAAGEYVGRNKDFYDELEKRDLEPTKDSGVRKFRGIALVSKARAG
jgi:putative DNA primase/helicase